MNTRIPLARPEITEADIKAVTDVLRTPQLSMGPKVAEFEEAICAYTKSPHAVAVNSGTSALHLAIRALNMPEGSEVILPSFTFIAPLNVLLQERMRPVFVDISARTYNVEPDAVGAAITPRTRAIIAVHTFGRPVQVDRLRTIARGRGIALIEDACEALGSEIGKEKVGTLGEIGTLAFYPNKQITTGEGGMLLTNDKKLAEAARRLRNQGRDASLDWYQHKETGYSYRLSEMNCALGIEQLMRLQTIIECRQSLAECYDARLRNVPGVLRPRTTVESGRISWFCYVIQFGDEIEGRGRDWIAESLAQKGIATGRYFAPLHRQPILHDSGSFVDLPVTDFVAARVLALPFFNQMTEAEVQEVCEALAASLEECRGRKT